METHNNHPKQHKGRGHAFAVALFSLAFLGLLTIGAAEAIAWNALSSNKQSLADVDKDGYQAVFLNNGQAYFGKLQSAKSSEYVKITDVWYLRTPETSGKDNKLQESSSDSVNATIVKLGGEIHGPKDEMLIAKNQILFYENLKDDGKVVQAIKEDTR